MGKVYTANKKNRKRKKSRKIVLLKDGLNDTLMNFDMNFTDKGKDVFKNLAKDERMINYQDLLDNLKIKTGNPDIDNFDF